MKYIVIAEEGERDLIAKYLPGCDYPVIVTGVGAINIIRSLQNVPRESELINIGYAGSANYEIGTLVEVTEVRLNHPNVTYKEPALPLESLVQLGIQEYRETGVVKAVDYTNCDFVLQSDYKDCVFDMELAFIASLGFKSLASLKIVSDNLSLHNYHEFTHGVE
jgi:hypothetical protein